MNSLSSEMERLNRAAHALLTKFEALDGLAFTEFDHSRALTADWNVLADTIGASGLLINEQAITLQRAGARLLEPFDTARQLKAEADTNAADRANHLTA